MRDLNKEKYVAMVSRKEVANLIGDCDDSDQGEIINDKITNELVASVALIVKLYEESRSSRARRV